MTATAYTSSTLSSDIILKYYLFGSDTVWALGCVMPYFRITPGSFLGGEFVTGTYTQPIKARIAEEAVGEIVEALERRPEMRLGATHVRLCDGSDVVF